MVVGPEQTAALLRASVPKDLANAIWSTANDQASRGVADAVLVAAIKAWPDTFDAIAAALARSREPREATDDDALRIAREIVGEAWVTWQRGEEMDPERWERSFVPVIAREIASALARPVEAPDDAAFWKERWGRQAAWSVKLAATLRLAHACATLRDDGTCGGCPVGDVLRGAPSSPHPEDSVRAGDEAAALRAVAALRRLQEWDHLTWQEYQARYPEAAEMLDDEFRRIVSWGLAPSGSPEPKGDLT